MNFFNIKTLNSKIAAFSVGTFFALAGTAGAATMTCTTTGPGSSAATLSLTDSLSAECFNGNDTSDIDLTTSIFGLTDWILADKSDDVTSGNQTITFTSGVTKNANSGGWAISSIGSAADVMVNLKAGNGWGSFLVDTTSGTWTSSKGLSHASIYYRAGTPVGTVPLPAAGWMLLAGLGGLVAAKRRKKV